MWADVQVRSAGGSLGSITRLDWSPNWHISRANGLLKGSRCSLTRAAYFPARGRKTPGRRRGVLAHLPSCHQPAVQLTLAPVINRPPARRVKPPHTKALQRGSGQSAPGLMQCVKFLQQCGPPHPHLHSSTHSVGGRD